jgi:hypothetical protein
VHHLVVTSVGAVYESINGDLTFLNSGVRELALCMTFRKKNSRGRFPINTESDFVAFQQSILAIDPNALSPGTYWWFYAEEVREVRHLTAINNKLKESISSVLFTCRMIVALLCPLVSAGNFRTTHQRKLCLHIRS